MSDLHARRLVAARAALEARAAAAATVASPLCTLWPPCAPAGRAVLGPWIASGPDCRNRSIACTDCAKTGDLSENLTLRKATT